MRGDGARDSQSDSASERIDDQSAEVPLSQAWAHRSLHQRIRHVPPAGTGWTSVDAHDAVGVASVLAQKSD